MQMHLPLTVIVIFACSIALSACRGGMAELENAELAHKRSECIRQNPTSPGKATACENIREECERRRKKGNFAC